MFSDGLRQLLQKVCLTPKGVETLRLRTSPLCNLDMLPSTGVNLSEATLSELTLLPVTTICQYLLE